jgi:hypothetical protein
MDEYKAARREVMIEHIQRARKDADCASLNDDELFSIIKTIAAEQAAEKAANEMIGMDALNRFNARRMARML